MPPDGGKGLGFSGGELLPGFGGPEPAAVFPDAREALPAGELAFSFTDMKLVGLTVVVSR